MNQMRNDTADTGVEDGACRSMPSDTDGGDRAFDAVLALFFPPSPDGGPVWTLTRGPSGMNNTTRYVACAGGRYILRVYETHRDEDKVAYEHHVLACLKRAGMAGLPVPEPVAALDGGTVVHTPDGKLAALFLHREGQNPVFASPDDFLDFGRSAGALSRVMATIAPDREPLYRPYYEHGLTPPEEIRQRVIGPLRQAGSDLEDLGAALDVVEAGLLDLHRRVPVLQALPHQLIHGDLNASNVLADAHNRIVALLDFEFVAWDLRVMELAVCLSEALPAPDAPMGGDAWACLSALVHGFTEQVRLVEAEAAVLPVLLQLRRLDVFLHFLRRWQDGVDTLVHARRFLLEAQAQAGWLARYGDRLARLAMPDAMPSGMAGPAGGDGTQTGRRIATVPSSTA